jgi:hypothetical protein
MGRSARVVAALSGGMAFYRFADVIYQKIDLAPVRGRKHGRADACLFSSIQ